MKIINALGLILILVLSACAVPQQPSQPRQVATPEPSAQEPAPAEETKTEVEEAPAEEAAAEAEVAAAGGDIVIKGKGVFDPETFKASTGSVVTFINNGDKLITLQFWDGKRVFKTDVLKSGETFEMEFNEEGTFEVKTLEFATGATIAVE